MAYLSTPGRLLQPSRARLAFGIVAVLAFVATELGRYVYRPWVRANEIEDFGLADSIGNLGGIVVQIFLVLTVLNSTREQSYRLAAFLSAGYVLYEFVQPYLPKGVFDWKDVWATGIGYVLALLVLRVLWSRFETGGQSSNRTERTAEPPDAGRGPTS